MRGSSAARSAAARVEAGIKFGGLRLIFAPISPARRPFATAKPEPPAAISVGTSSRKPHGMAVLTAIIVAWGANNSLRAGESQKIAIARIATAPATRWIILLMALLSFLQARFDYATQIPGTATFWNRCGEATAEDG